MQTLARPVRRALVAAFALLGLIVAGSAAHVVLGVGDAGWDAIVRDWCSSAVYVLVAAIVTVRAVGLRSNRAAWIVLAIGISLYGAGNLLWALWLEHVPEPPIPSVCDLLWLALYPFSYLGLVLLGRPRGDRIPAGVWLDGIVAGLGMAAIGSEIVFPRVLAGATGSVTSVTTNLAYPVGDLLLAALVMGLLALRGWRIDRQWALLGGGFIVLAVADSIYLLQVASGTSDSSLVANLFYMTGVSLLALAACHPARRVSPPRVEGRSMLIIPGAFATSALALLGLGHFVVLDGLTFSLAMLTVIAALIRALLTFRDVRALATSRREALTDDLTDLPNRRMFLRRMEELIAQARSSGRRLPLLMIDLDRFKELNDTLGHEAGDRLLEQIGPRLLGAARPGDFVARLGGDEFAVILTGDTGEAEAALVAERLLAAIEEPFEILSLAIAVRASIGVALFPDHAAGTQELLRRADIAMYQAKTARGRYEVYAAELDTSSLDRLTLTGELRAAVSDGAIDVFFQPKADAAGRRVTGVEALARWIHPERGVISPTVFIPISEQAGLSRALTRHVLDRSLAQRAVWGHLDVSVNVTVADLLDVGFPNEVAATLERHGVPAEALVLEITESSILSDPARITVTLERLDAIGVRVSLDDFGTGYSSLAHLRALPVQEVKIDRSFVTSMLSDPADAAIVRAIVALAHELGMLVVAEGVEDEATWEALAALGCDTIQGYVLSRPLPAEALDAVLSAQQIR